MCRAQRNLNSTLRVANYGEASTTAYINFSAVCLVLYIYTTYGRDRFRAARNCICYYYIIWIRLVTEPLIRIIRTPLHREFSYYNSANYRISRRRIKANGIGRRAPPAAKRGEKIDFERFDPSPSPSPRPPLPRISRRRREWESRA